MKPNGVLVLKEPLTYSKNGKEYICNTGQGMIYRKWDRLRNYIGSRFTIKNKDENWADGFGWYGFLYAERFTV